MPSLVCYRTILPHNYSISSRLLSFSSYLRLPFPSMGAAKEAPAGAHGAASALLAKAATPLLALAIFFLLFLFALRKESQLLSLSPVAAQAPVGALAPAAAAAAAAAAAPPAQLCPCSQALVLDYFEIGTVRHS